MLQFITPFYSRSQQGESQLLTIPNSHINYSELYSFNGQGKTETFSIRYVLQGKENYQVNDRRYKVPEGHYLVVSPDREVCLDIKSVQEVEGVRIFLPEGLIKDVWTTVSNTPEKLLENEYTGDLPEFFEYKLGCRNDKLGNFVSQIGQAIKTEQFNSQEVNDIFFYQAALELCQEQKKHLNKITSIYAQKKSTRQELYRRVLEVRDYIHANFYKQITLPELAQIANLSEFHFLRSFKSVFGEAPYTYLLHLRLDIAKNALLQKKQNITELALSVGFQEAQAFCKLFRQKYGMGPTKFVKQSRNRKRV